MKKRCTRCKEVKPWGAFYAGKKWPDGTMRVPQSRCKECMAEIQAEQRPRNSVQREKHKLWQRKAYQRWKLDPEWAGKKRAQDRDGRRRRNGTPPEKFRTSKYMRQRETGETLPSGPFKAWLEYIGQRDAIGREEVLRRCGLPESKTINGHVTLAVVERAILEEGSATLRDVYPELYA